MKKGGFQAAAVIVCMIAAVSLQAQNKKVSGPKEAKVQKNPVVFWELASNDQEASVKFFRDVFEWDIEFSERLGFYIIPAGEKAKGVDGGIFTLKKAKLPFLTVYLLVDDIEAKAKLVEKHGGHIVEPPIEISPGTMICLFNEPSGVTFAMLQPKEK
ncbi:VOC family protein [Acidobacteriota bacterium]